MICIPVMARDTGEAIAKIARASAMADMVEIRLDRMGACHLESMVQASSKPVLVTYRSRKEGGEGSDDDDTRLRYLLKAIEARADFVDMEFSLPVNLRQKIFHVQGPFKVIVSMHLLHETPMPQELEDILKKMASTGADIVKIITWARVPEDNLHVLHLISKAQDLGVKIITFCMGPIGRLSRVASILLGGYLTFASLEEGEESAGGQIPIIQMKKILEIMRG